MAHRAYSVTDVFEKWPEKKSVLTLAMPAVISQLVTTAYNLTDTFFVGQVGTDKEMAAISISYTAMILLNTIANLFGVGGSSLMSRAMGEKNALKSHQAATFSLYGSVLFSVLYSLLMLLFPSQLALLFGATETFMKEARDYLFFCITVGAVPAVLTMVYGHLIRAEGSAKQASFGLCLGAVANIILDPIFIFPFGLNMGVAGAALATALSNWLAVAYYLLYMIRNHRTTILSFNPKWFTVKKEISFDIISVGFPQSIKTTMSSISGSVLNHLAAPFGEYVVAAAGVAHKFDQIPMHIATGFSAGSLPMIGYNYAAKRYDRMKNVMKYTMRYAMYVSAGFVIGYMLLADVLARGFVQDAMTAQYSALFIRMLCLGLPGMAGSFILTALFQATGRAKEALFLSLYRKGAMDIPLLFLFNMIWPLYGLLLVQLVVDTSALVIATMMYRRFLRELKVEKAIAPQEA